MIFNQGKLPYAMEQTVTEFPCGGEIGFTSNRVILVLQNVYFAEVLSISYVILSNL